MINIVLSFSLSKKKKKKTVFGRYFFNIKTLNKSVSGTHFDIVHLMDFNIQIEQYFIINIIHTYHLTVQNVIN